MARDPSRIATSPHDPILHPYANSRALEHQSRLVITEGDGIYVFDDKGDRYIEAMASLWYANLGFSEHRLADAAYRQLCRMPCYHAFSNKAVDVSIELANKLIEIAPQPMATAFFACSGSEANDTALKLVDYYYNELGRLEKKKIIARHMGYHGVTYASASLTGVPRNHAGFDLPMSRVIHTDCPDYYRHARRGETEEQFSQRLAESLEQTIKDEGPDTIGAFIAEPVMGVGGVVPPPSTYFDKIQSVLRKYDILFIADEVICGFGRLGDMFGTQTFNLKPDMITIAKGFSSGYVPISALMLNQKVYDVVADASASHGVFGHGFTYSSHPVGAAVALEAIRIYEADDIIGHVCAVAPHLHKRLAELRGSPIVGDVRGHGLIAGIQLMADPGSRTFFDPTRGVGKALERECEKQGVIARALGDVLAIAPPLIISEEQINELVERLKTALHGIEATYSAVA